MTAGARLLQALLRDDFRAFTEKVFVSLNPGQPFIRSWHLEAIAYQLERVRRGDIKRLIINMPPRSLKSIMSSVAFPAFVLGLNPSRRIICVSYSGELAKKHSNDFRAVLDMPWYKSTFPKTRVGQYKNNESEVELTERGFRLQEKAYGGLLPSARRLLDQMVKATSAKPAGRLELPQRIKPGSELVRTWNQRT